MTITAPPLYRVESVESAVKATIRQVASPTVRDVMWSAWQDALADAVADSSDCMPWERERAATVITEDAADRAMVRMLEAITDTGYRRSIRDLLALECEFTHGGHHRHRSRQDLRALRKALPVGTAQVPVLPS